MSVTVKFKKDLFEDKVEFESEIKTSLLRNVLREFARQHLSREKELSSKVSIWINKKPLEVEKWSSYELEDGDEVTIVPKVKDVGLAVMGVESYSYLTFLGKMVAVAINIAAMTAVSFLAQLVFPPQQPDSSGDNPNYGWEGIQNTSAAGIPVPILYGKHMTGGNVISVDTIYQTVNQWHAGYVDIGKYGPQKNYLEVLIAFSEGPIEGLALEEDLGLWKFSEFPQDIIDWFEEKYPGSSKLLEWARDFEQIPYIKINDQPASSYDDVQYFLSNGSDDPYILSRMSSIKNYYPQIGVTFAGELDGKKMQPTYITYVTQEGKDISAVKLHFQFPQGLFFMHDDGDRIPRKCQLQIKYRPYQSSGSFKPINYHSIECDADEDGISVGAVGVIGKYYSPAYFSVLLDKLNYNGITSGRWEIKIRQTTYNTNKKCVDTLDLIGVTEYEKSNVSYVNTALLFVRALATDRLSGSLPKITFVAYGKKVRVPHLVTTYLGKQITLPYHLCYYDDENDCYKWSLDKDAVVSFHPTKKWVTQYTNNPVWCYVDLLMNETYGLGEYLDPDDLKIDEPFEDGQNEWLEQAKICDTLVRASSNRTGIIVNFPGVRTELGIYINSIFDEDYTFKREDIGRFVVTTNSNGESTKNRIAYTFDVVDFDKIKKKFNNNFGDLNLASSDRRKHFALLVGQWTNGPPATIGKPTTYWLEEKQYELDLVVQDREEALDQLSRIGQTFRGISVYSEGSIKLKIDKLEEPVHILTMGNILDEGTGENRRSSLVRNYLSKKSIINTLEGHFYDKMNEYKKDTRLMVWDEAIQAGEEERKQEIDFRGITRESQVARIMSYMLRSAQYRKTSIKLKAMIDAIHAQATETINIPLIQTNGRILGYDSTTNEVTIDKDITIEEGKVYRIHWRVPTSSSYSINEYSISNSPGTTRVIKIDGSIPESERPIEWETPYIITELSKGIKRYKITKISHTEEDNVNIEAIEDADEIYETDVLPFGERTTPSTMPSPTAGVEDVEDLTLTTLIGRRGTFGIGVGWRLPENSLIDEVEILLSRLMENGEKSTWEKIGTSNTETFEIWEDIDVQITYYVKVVSISKGRGKSKGVEQSIVVLPDKPAKPTHLQLANKPDETEFDGKDCVIEWKRHSESGGVGTEKERTSRKVLGLSWEDKFFKEYSIVVKAGGENIEQKATSFSKFVYTFEKNKEDFENNSSLGKVQPEITFEIRTRDIFGQVSEPATLTVKNSTPDPPQNLVLDNILKLVTLRWDVIKLEKGTDLDKVAIYRKAGDGDFVKIDEVSVKQNWYIDREIEKDVVYTYKLTVIDVYEQESDYSESKQITGRGIIPDEAPGFLENWPEAIFLEGKRIGIDYVPDFGAFLCVNCYYKDATDKWRFATDDGYAWVIGKGNWDALRIYRSTVTSTGADTGPITWKKVWGLSDEPFAAPTDLTISKQEVRYLPGGTVRTDALVEITFDDPNDEIVNCEIRHWKKRV